ncbi:MAG: hypothetical protein IJ760_07755 [Bacteroidales bacterium]|nr:hypothetical protein [Bacteroidales bacterium]
MAKKTDLSLRISKVRAMFCGDDNRKFALELGISEQLASSICTGNKPAGDGTLNKVLNAFPRVSKAWLFLGEGDMLRPESTLNANHVGNAAIGNSVSGDIVQVENKHKQEKSDVDRLITLLENKDRQIDRLIALLEERYSKAE